MCGVKVRVGDMCCSFESLAATAESKGESNFFFFLVARKGGKNRENMLCTLMYYFISLYYGKYHSTNVCMQVLCL